MKLYKILESIIDEQDVINGKKYLLEFGQKYDANIKLGATSYNFGVFYIGGSPSKVVARYLKEGDVFKLSLIYSTRPIPEAMKADVIAQVDDLPHPECSKRARFRSDMSVLASTLGIDTSLFNNKNRDPTVSELVSNIHLYNMCAKFAKIGNSLRMFDNPLPLSDNGDVENVIDLLFKVRDWSSGCMIYYINGAGKLIFCRNDDNTCRGNSAVDYSTWKCSSNMNQILGATESSNCTSSDISCFDCRPRVVTNAKTAKDMVSGDYDFHEESAKFYINCEKPTIWDIVLNVGYHYSIDECLKDPNGAGCREVHAVDTGAQGGGTGTSGQGSGFSLGNYIIVALIVASIAGVLGIFLGKFSKGGGFVSGPRTG